MTFANAVYLLRRSPCRCSVVHTVLADATCRASCANTPNSDVSAAAAVLTLSVPIDVPELQRRPLRTSVLRQLSVATA
ncbi:hypothetical protein EYF80_019013 [Liparis tanakae]|uniref:Uncharacterized protein n=1 Tax=Liparis tanakae TaxID=230148 RepID=A0A4Z2HYW3_9TELE|nr:hypothetical protein EYF80_019013 [Liparis tanakae]